MSNIKTWISAARPRTLFLAAAAVILGSGLALNDSSFSVETFVWTFLLAVSIQILANFANDLGDYEKGTDTTGKREGPTRALQSGNINKRQMKTALLVSVTLVAFFGITSIWRSIGWQKGGLIMLIVGALSIFAALFYTMGKHAYGYKGWGDLSAFLFFGPVPVLGTYYLHTGQLNWHPLFPAIGLGFISDMILNVNNMRDIDNDRLSGKITVAAKLGINKAKVYHALLTLGVFACFLEYSIMFEPSVWYKYLYAIVFIFLLHILMGIRNKSKQELDPYLKFTSLSGFFLTVLFSICIIV
ncbi:MAG: 1,4-dihydroxy-2-naphthoate octaprenyltransferase [Bacteroidetes bacterium ADurb.BinA174]|nr:MAG: 1,4-dihydroxy-2-naphthoate octaprenyltransferase [Bacteroidetes bacterium ADurb.BinA174]